LILIVIPPYYKSDTNAITLESHAINATGNEREHKNRLGKDGYPPSQDRGLSRRKNSHDGCPSGKDGIQYECLAK
jgi:hypothetical protein